jgi:hypothetical protein
MIQILHYALLILGNSDLFRQLKFENPLINKKVTLSYHFINNFPGRKIVNLEKYFNFFFFLEKNFTDVKKTETKI